MSSSAVPGSTYVPSNQFLTLGSRGPAVKALQNRLNFLHYYAGKADGRFGWATMEAVWAFKEVQQGKWDPTNHNIVGPAMQRQLVNPKLPSVYFPTGGRNRVEVNKYIEVLVVYRFNKIALITHISTADYNRPDGSGWVTPNGQWRALYFIRGWVQGSLGAMYNPVVISIPSIGDYAIHGEPNPTSTFSYDGVPLNPASHGCIRIPMEISQFLHTLIHIGSSGGSRVYIFGPDHLSWP